MKEEQTFECFIKYAEKYTFTYNSKKVYVYKHVTIFDIKLCNVSSFVYGIRVYFSHS